jgi:hypothetical protein
MVKVGRYTVEERKDRILRYLKKRNQRNFNKTIKVIKFLFNLISYLILYLENVNLNYNFLDNITVCLPKNPS